ncbi:DUF4350 domain-containing protein [Haloferax larsenii]|uniref:DUF4350 domain-containing protein n=1 Tax=Haloferax larsenii TaxID=302484 RepID=A0A1H7PRS6_HALLR|nr:DUF4350 domain-containing protein [Haloferax larsenii]SEL38571.1 protein of unknown function [Haloferax larsenii]
MSSRRRIPKLAFVIYVVVVAASLGVAAGTSSIAFDAYNTKWDGSSSLRTLASNSDIRALTLTEPAQYDRVEPVGAVAFVGAPSDPSPEQLAALRSFVRAGGTLVVADDYGTGGNAVLEGVGADARFDGRVLRDERLYYRDPALPIARNVTQHNFTTGVEALTLNYGTAIYADSATTLGENGTPVVAANGTAELPESLTPLVRASTFSYLDTNGDGEPDPREPMAAHPVATVEPVGNGRVVAVSDPSLFINAMLDRPGNRAFASALVEQHDRVVIDQTGSTGTPALAVVEQVVRTDQRVQVIVGVGVALAVGFLAAPRRERRPGSDRS